MPYEVQPSSKHNRAMTPPGAVEAMTTQDDFEAPLPLVRALSYGFVDEEQVDNSIRYLQFECNYQACKYKDPHDIWTWGRIVKEDYPHFVELMSEHVPLASMTFQALKSHLTGRDLEEAEKKTRFIDTPEYENTRVDAFMQLTCQHKGRMNGKTWATIKKEDYNYFVWAVGNTMGRDTITFETLSKSLCEPEKAYVMATEKGQVKVAKRQKTKSTITPAR
jgi:hypothetical protein